MTTVTHSPHRPKHPLLARLSSALRRTPAQTVSHPCARGHLKRLPWPHDLAMEFCPRCGLVTERLRTAA